MLDILESIFETQSIEVNDTGERRKLSSNTSKDQGLFLQTILEEIKPQQSVEIGLALGISSLFILEKLRSFGNKDKSHVIMEPFPWGTTAEYNIEKAGLTYLADYRYKKSDEVLPQLYYEGKKIQFAYVDTTKLFDVILTDFYFIDKLLDVNGVVVFDDCGGQWPGVQRVIRFINSLPHYKVYKTNAKVQTTSKRNLAQGVVKGLLNAVPFKNKFFPGYSFKSDTELGLDYSCIAFMKTAEDPRKWNVDYPF